MMKIAILANSAASYVKPMAEGLQRMLSRIGVDSTVFYDGLAELGRVPDAFDQYVTGNGTAGWSVAKRVVKYMVKETPATWRFIHRLRAFDAIVIVSSIPRVFLKSFFSDGPLRSLLPHTPIVLYDVFYLPTRGPWGKWLKDGNPEKGVPVGGNWGLERYDWYLCASVVSETPIPPGPQPYSLVGLDLDDGTLRPDEKTEFLALLDFEYPAHMRERAVQIQACEESDTKYVVLNGQYSINEIRRIYRQTSIYFLASRESFGLPTCELQACGSYVFTPYSHWCPSHWLKADLSREGPGELSPNFVVYQNDTVRLIKELERIKAAYDPNAVVANFRRYHPQFFRGNEAELEDFVQKLQDRAINSQSHRNYAEIVGHGDFPSFDPEPSLSRVAR
jgi:hypothetical protein